MHVIVAWNACHRSRAPHSNCYLHSTRDPYSEFDARFFNHRCNAISRYVEIHWNLCYNKFHLTWVINSEIENCSNSWLNEAKYHQSKQFKTTLPGQACRDCTTFFLHFTDFFYPEDVDRYDNWTNLICKWNDKSRIRLKVKEVCRMKIWNIDSRGKFPALG